MRRIALTLAGVMAIVASGCAMARGTATAIDAANQAVVANEQIVQAYHEAVMEGFEAARAAHVNEAKHIVDGLAVTTQPTKDAPETAMVPADVVKDGFDRLLANLNQVEGRRDRFLELYRLARQNNANAKEALFLASDLVMRSSATQEELRNLLTQALSQLKTGGE